MQRYLLCIILGVLLLLTGCSGDDGNSSVSKNVQGNGSVAVMLTDGPADDYDHIWIWITEISLLPGDNDDPVVVYESDDPEGWKVDLLDLRDQEAVVTVNDDIPAGHYRKIRLRIADILPEGENTPCDNMEIKLPGGKIDLKPKGGFDVIPDETIAIRLDIDCNKSIRLHPAGKSGKCIFQPVVFVEIDTPDIIKKCPRVLKGTIKRVYDENTGFTLRLGHGRGLLRVNLSDDVVIFGANGMPVPPEELAHNQLVHVRGQLDKAGNMLASDIVIGRVLLIKGMVETPYDAEEAMLSLNLMLLDFFTDFIVDVKVSENTLVMAGCDQRVDPSVIQAGMMARVVAKVSLEDWSIRAIAVLLKDVNDIDTPTDDPDMPRDITGMLMDVSEPDEEGGYVLSVEVGDTEPEEIYMEAGVEPTIDIPGEDPLAVSIDVLKELTGCVEVSITAESNGSSHMIASDVRVDAEAISGFVEEIIEDVGRTVTVRLDTDYIVTVIIDSPYMSIDTNYFLEAIGLNTCDGPEYFLAIEVEITSN